MMCLINFHFQDHPNYKLIIAANRDEIYERPTAPAQFWDDNPDILDVRDVSRIGTRPSITKSVCVAALTSCRDPNEDRSNKRSCGHIVRHFLVSSIPAADFSTKLQYEKDLYTGFNFIGGSPEQLYYYSNIQNEMSQVSTGTHGLSNAFLNTPWPKVVKGKEKLAQYVK